MIASAIAEIYAIPFMRQALLAACLAGAMLGYLGLFVVLRRAVFLGAALPQFAALGLAAAILAGAAPAAGAFAGAAFGVLVVSAFARGARLPTDAVLGVGFALASSGAILLLARSAEGEMKILAILSGDILGTTPGEVDALGFLAAGVALVHAVFLKEFVFVSSDPEAAEASGLRVRLWDGLLFLTLAAAVALSMRVMGAVVSFALLVGPSAAALLSTRRLGLAIPLAAALGALAGAAGLTVSFLWDLPSGPAIAAAAAAAVFPAAILHAVRNRR